MNIHGIITKLNYFVMYTPLFGYFFAIFHIFNANIVNILKFKHQFIKKVPLDFI